jgi:hypothetical protein
MNGKSKSGFGHFEAVSTIAGGAVREVARGLRLTVVAGLLALACSNSSNGGGGSSSTGGSTGNGGVSASGGKTVGSGGEVGSGGAVGSGDSNSGSTTVKGGSSDGADGSAGTAGGNGVTGAGGVTSPGGTTGPQGPCDLYRAGNNPCVAAHSTLRALLASYGGNLYQVRRASDKTTKDIPLQGPGGFVDSSVREEFCANTTCAISHICDQSELKNDLPLSPPAHWLPDGETKAVTGPGKGQAKVGGHTVYGIYLQPDGGGSGGNTHRNHTTKGIAKMDEPESISRVVDGKYYNGRCCFDYGNVQTTGNDDGNASMETLNFSTIANWSPGSGSGPWIMADLEDGVCAGGQTTGKVASNTPIVANYVTGMLRGFSGNRYGMKAGDAQSGTLSVKHDGVRPPGWSPQKKQGAVELGVGGDRSSGGCGIFFEGAMTTGVSTDAVDDAIQASIVAAGTGAETTTRPA